MTPLNRRCFATKPTEHGQQVDSFSLLPTPERMRCSHTRSNLLQPRGFQDFQVRLVLTVRLRSWWCLKLAQHFPELLCSSLLLRFVQVERCWRHFSVLNLLCLCSVHASGAADVVSLLPSTGRNAKFSSVLPQKEPARLEGGRNCFPCCTASTKCSGAHSRGKGELSDGLQHDRGVRGCL